MDAELIERLMGFIKNKTLVTLQVKDLVPTTGIRHYHESKGERRIK
jgi:hypothetical protein